MKTIFAFIILAYCYSGNAQTEFHIQFNQGYGSIPTYKEIDETEALTKENAESLFQFLKDSTQLEFRYSFGGCEDRAHAMSLFLNKKNIESRKIWNFDPYYISLFNAQQNLSAVDRSGLNNKVYWGFHVAPIVKIKSGDIYSLAVLDPSVSDSLLTINQWLDLQDAPNSHFTFTDSEWLTFVTINGLNFNSEPMPNNFPTLLTGDFYMNEGDNFENLLVEEGIAMNKVAMLIVEEVINNPNIESVKKNKYKTMLLNSSDFTNSLTQESSPFSQDIEILEFQKYKEIFTIIKKEWKLKLDNLRSIK